MNGVKLTCKDHILFWVCIIIIGVGGIGCASLVWKEACPTARTEYERLAWAYQECKDDPGCFTTINDLQQVDLARSRVQTMCTPPRVDKSQE